MAADVVARPKFDAGRRVRVVLADSPNRGRLGVVDQVRDFDDPPSERRGQPRVLSRLHWVYLDGHAHRTPYMGDDLEGA